MLLSNARLGDRAVDVRVEDGVIAEIGSLGTGDIDLAGRWLSPGLWDHHVHFTQWALHSQRVNLLPATSAADAAQLVSAAIRPGTTGLLIGGGFRDSLWADAPSLEVLDRISGGRPVVLVSADLHSVWLNSAALKSYGHVGHPTGLLSEDDAFGVTKQLGAFPDTTIDSWAEAAAEAAARRGVVGIVDLEMAWNVEAWGRRIAYGADQLRVEFTVYTEHLDRAIAEGFRTGQKFGDLLTMGRYKVLTDGSLNSRTAYTFDQYPDGGRGQLTVPLERLIPLMQKAADAGILPDVHAIGDHATSLALDAFAATGCGGRIEHAQLTSEGDFARFAQLGVEVSVQPEQAMDDRDVADRLWAGRTGRTYAFRSMLDAGATLWFGSDAPVAPLDPWVTLAAAVSRSRDGRRPWHPEQCVTNAQALAASTHTTVEVGQSADFVVTDLNPLTATGEQLRTMPVAMTLLAGRVTHDGH